MLSGKNILLISPQPWGGLFVSKHHYAVALARRGNNVFFLCPIPLESNQSAKVKIVPVPGYKRLFLIEHKLWFPFQIKFHFKGLFDVLMGLHLKRILRTVKKEFDIVWSFDLGDYFPFRFFSEKVLCVFHPVDEPLNQTAFDASQGSQVIFSVTPDILAKYQSNSAPKFLINHGVDDVFFNQEVGIRKNLLGDIISIGFSGNLRRKDIDRSVFLDIVRFNKKLRFECFGSYALSDNNPDRDDISTDAFIADLNKEPNVILHGLLTPEQLAAAYQKMDAFLICYDVSKDQSAGTNYHKVLEFLSSGKIVVSNNITAYSDRPDLVQMVSERNDNQQLSSLFTQVVAHLSEFNSENLMKQRIAYAGENRYDFQIDKIESILLNISR